jgi:hypothetical protein
MGTYGFETNDVLNFLEFVDGIFKIPCGPLSIKSG